MGLFLQNNSDISSDATSLEAALMSEFLDGRNIKHLTTVVFRSAVQSDMMMEATTPNSRSVSFF